MSNFGQTVKGYIWWTYPRGSVHYDVMVTVILAFIFLTPHLGQLPGQTAGAPAASDRSHRAAGRQRVVYKVDASAVKAGSDADIRESLLRIIEPVSGEITIDRYETVRDEKHNLVAYKVWAHR